MIGGTNVGVAAGEGVAAPVAPVSWVHVEPSHAQSSSETGMAGRCDAGLGGRLIDVVSPPKSSSFADAPSYTSDPPLTDGGVAAGCCSFHADPFHVHVPSGESATSSCCAASPENIDAATLGPLVKVVASFQALPVQVVRLPAPQHGMLGSPGAPFGIGGSGTSGGGAASVGAEPEAPPLPTGGVGAPGDAGTGPDV